MKKKLLFSLTLLLLLSCGSNRSATQPLSHSVTQPLLPQKEQTWQLVSLRGRSLDPTAAAPTLVINPEAGTLSGFAYCNKYFYNYTLRPESVQPDGDYYTLSLQSSATGSLGCPEADMNAESRYLLLLDKATRLRVTATTLTFYQRNKEILHFELQ